MYLAAYDLPADPPKARRVYRKPSRRVGLGLLVPSVLPGMTYWGMPGNPPVMYGTTAKQPGDDESDTLNPTTRAGRRLTNGEVRMLKADIMRELANAESHARARLPIADIKRVIHSNFSKFDVPPLDRWNRMQDIETEIMGMEQNRELKVREQTKGSKLTQQERLDAITSVIGVWRASEGFVPRWQAPLPKPPSLPGLLRDTWFNIPGVVWDGLRAGGSAVRKGGEAVYDGLTDAGGSSTAATFAPLALGAVAVIGLIWLARK